MSLLASLVRRAVEAVAAHLPPPRVIFDRLGERPYLSRYYLAGAPIHPDGEHPFDADGAPRKGVEWQGGWGVYLHRFHRGDDDIELHNHPWDWAISLILAGGYTEERRTPNQTVERQEFHPGSLNWIRSSTFHRVELLEHDAWTLFIVGPKVGSWGFWERETGIYTPWREHIDTVRAIQSAREALHARAVADFRGLRT